MASDKGKPDFSNVKASTATTAPPAPRADFSNVKATTASTAAVPEPAAQTYTVAKGDSLSKIARKFYGNANRWKWIHEANREQVPNPDLIKVGQVLVIPPAPKS
jgi:nucleoid-associated protein YgaU